MKYTLYQAKDTRDGKSMLWLIRGVWPARELALFSDKTEPPVIKRKTAAAPESITWEPTAAWYSFAAIGEAKIVAEWEFNT